MSAGSKLTGLLVAGILCLPVAAQADTQTAHRVHKAKKQQPPPPLPSGTRGPVPQIPLDAIPAVAPTINFQHGMLTIVAPNSTLGDILRGVRKQTAADIDIPAAATERVATRLGPGPAREVIAELLNGSHFNYILLGSPENSNLLVRVVLVAKTGPDTLPPTATQAENNPAPTPDATAEAPEAEVMDESAAEEVPDQGTVEAEQQPPVTGDQPGVKTPQQMLQEMQQRQLQMQQQQNGQQPVYPPPGMPMPQRPQPPPQEQQ
ncbi:MAG: hypothetical protein QOF94_1812 [Acidobacteriaceae bacterium]